MAKPRIFRLIEALKSKDWHRANTLVASLLETKAMARLDEEKKKLAEDDEKFGQEGEPDKDAKPEDEKVDESAPEDMESWVKANKTRFKKEYGAKKGEQVLYATANKHKGEHWKGHGK